MGEEVAGEEEETCSSHLNHPAAASTACTGGDNSPHSGAAPVTESQPTGVRQSAVLLGRATTADDDDGDLELQPLGRPQDAGSCQRVPLYSLWPGRNKFFCNGMLMTGGETEVGITANCSAPNLCVWVCILAPSSVYFTWVFPHLIKQGSYAMPFATLIVFLMASGFLLATCCSDPGIIPRREVVLASDIAAQLEATLGYDMLISENVPRDGQGGATYMPQDLTRQGYRWCRTCRVVRPPRASHCPDCDNCVLRYDHHCPFVNNCVGQRNYHFFFGFVTSVICLALLVLPVLFWFLNSDKFELVASGLNTALEPLFYALIACGSLVGIAAVLSMVLWIYHLFLITTRQTTKEFRRQIPNAAEEPTLCAERGPRLFDPWALVDPQDMEREGEAPRPEPSSVCSACFGDD